MVSANTGFIVGKNSINLLLERIMDLWQTWDSTIFYFNENEGMLSDVFFINSTHEFATAKAWRGIAIYLKTLTI